VQQGVPPESLTSLADLVTVEPFKAVLRHYLTRAEGKANAFAVTLAKTLIDVARYQVKLPDDAIKELKRIAAKLPAVPFDLNEKNKELLRQLESDQARARLLFLPEELRRAVDAKLKKGRLPFVDAQVAVAIAILLVAPLRPQNLVDLNWRRNFKEPNGPKATLTLYIPKSETKSRKRDLTHEIAEEDARTIRWYRDELLPRLSADIGGDLFVTRVGERKDQKTLTVQIIKAIEKHVGVHMTPHQFRHFAAALYLERRPDDFQTVTDLLGHSWAKTTLIYAGSSTRRASRAYASHLLEQRQDLKLKRHAKKRRKGSPCGP
jgi:integrase